MTSGVVGAARARVVLVCGPAGAGKTTHAQALERSGYVRLSFDEEAWERGYRVHPLSDAAAAEVHAVLTERLVGLIGEGRDVVVDTSFWSRASRDRYRALVEPLGVTAVVHYLDVPPDLVRARLSRRTDRGPHDVAVPPERARAYLAGFEVPAVDEGPLVVVKADVGDREAGQGTA